MLPLACLAFLGLLKLVEIGGSEVIKMFLTLEDSSLGLFGGDSEAFPVMIHGYIYVNVIGFCY